MRGSILIVDDEQTLVETISDHLAMGGLDVAGACSAEEALELTRARSFDVVVTDLRLPGMSGLDLLRAFAALERRPAVILTTAYGTMELVVEAFRLGLTDFHEKPVCLDALSRSVDRALAARWARAAEPSQGVPGRALCEHSRRLGRVRVEVAGDPSAALATAVWHVRSIERARTGFVWAHAVPGSRLSTIARVIVRALAEVVDLGRPAEAVETIASCLSALDCRSVLRAVAVGAVEPNGGGEVSGASFGDAGLFRLDAARAIAESVGGGRGEHVATWRTTLAPEDALVLVDARLVAAKGARVDAVLAQTARALAEGAPDPARRTLAALSEPAIEAPVVVACHVGAAVSADEPLHLRLTPSRAALVRAREAAEQFLVDAQLDEDSTHEVVTAVQEALLNCMRWAYPGGEGPIWLTVSNEAGCLRACVHDEGLGFDVAETLAHAADAAGDPLRRAGRGLGLMRRCVDRFELVSTPVTLEKNTRPAADEPSGVHEGTDTT
jgi:FixJ family two-component response regulator/anti-sigma regulatory factor (Ser/Thr protein kinase)